MDNMSKKVVKKVLAKTKRKVLKPIYAVGDIHGNFDALAEMLKKIPKGGKIVFLGDYVDRGPDSYKVVEMMMRLSKKPNVICLKGNHEQMMVNYAKGKGKQHFLFNGGIKTINSYKKAEVEVFPKKHIQWMESLPLYYETPKYIFVHAGIIYGKPLASQSESTLLWVRYSFIKNKSKSDKKVVFGHTIFSKPYVRHNKIGIDTGAGWGDRLTCVMLPEEKFIQV